MRLVTLAALALTATAATGKPTPGSAVPAPTTADFEAAVEPIDYREALLAAKARMARGGTASEELA